MNGSSYQAAKVARRNIWLSAHSSTGAVIVLFHGVVSSKVG